jgi:hypothetical protein
LPFAKTGPAFEKLLSPSPAPWAGSWPLLKPAERITACVDCGAAGVQAFDPDTDRVFRARRGFYRDPVVEALASDEPNFMSLIAAEHSAGLWSKVNSERPQLLTKTKSVPGAQLREPMLLRCGAKLIRRAKRFPPGVFFRAESRGQTGLQTGRLRGLCERRGAREGHGPERERRLFPRLLLTGRVSDPLKRKTPCLTQSAEP